MFGKLISCPSFGSQNYIWPHRDKRGERSGHLEPAAKQQVSFSVSYPLRGASGGAGAVFVHFRVKVGRFVDHPGG